MKSTCTGACGLMSRNASTCSSSNTMSAGISRRMIFENSVVIAGSSGRDLGARAERVRERAAVDVFEFATERDAVREPARAHTGMARQLREVLGRRLALDGRIGGDDQLLHVAVSAHVG